MENDYRNRFIFIALILILMAFAIGPLSLGIDLKGGAELVYSVESADDRKLDELMDKAIGVIQNRIDPQGTSGYQVTPSNNRLLITMGGANNTEIARVQKLLQKSGSLEMRLELRHDAYRRADYVKAERAFRKGEENPIKDTTWYQVSSGRWILVENKAYIKGDMLKTAHSMPSPEDPSTWIVDLQFRSPDGVDKLREVSEVAFNNHKSGMAIILNDLWNEDHTELIRQGTCDSSPSVQGVFTNGRCTISGNYSSDDAKELVTVLDSGSLPFLIKPESSVIVGPSLGQESINKGQFSCFVGLALVFVFMFFYYGRMGLVANLCLAINLFIIWAGMSLFNFVLTLPGIAGVILTVGMAVDANVLIFERIKEELREGYKLARAVNTGYEKAFVTIFDSNITTFLTGVILYSVGSGAVKGFAVTLCMGIAASMFSAIYVSRTVVDWMMETGRLTKMSERRLYNGNINFLGALQKLGTLVSLVVVVWGVMTVVQKGRDNLGIDFVGGTRLQLSFRDYLNVDEVKQGANAAFLSEEFTYQDDALVIPVKGPDESEQSRYRQFIIKTKNTNNEKVEEALIAHFGDRLQPQSLDVYEKNEPLKFIEFNFTATEKLDRLVLENELKEKLSDPELILAPSKEENSWSLYLSTGRSVKELGGFLSGILGERLRPENIRWNPEDPKKVVLNLVKVVEIKEFVDEIEHLDPALKGVTAVPSKEDNPSIMYADSLLVTLAREMDPITFEKLILDTGLVKMLPIKEGKVINRMLYTTVRVFSRDGPDALRELLAQDDLTLLRAKQGQGDEWILQVGGADFPGDIDDLQGKVTAVLANYVSNPVVANTTIRGTVAQEMSQQALWALLLSLVAIVIYITFRFEFRFGLASIAALIHDVAVSLGVLSFLNVEFDLTIVGALLTIVGYSLNDTIVIFDRIRENLRLWGSKSAREVINISINQTLSRTLLTSITTLLVVVVLNFFAGEGLKPFSTALIIGIISGTYSSVFVASPLLVLFGGGLRSGLRVREEKDEQKVDTQLDPTTNV